MRNIEIFIRMQKSEWFRCLKEFYNLAKTLLENYN